MNVVYEIQSTARDVYSNDVGALQHFRLSDTVSIQYFLVHDTSVF